MFFWHVNIKYHQLTFYTIGASMADSFTILVLFDHNLTLQLTCLNGSGSRICTERRQAYETRIRTTPIHPAWSRVRDSNPW